MKPVQSAGKMKLMGGADKHLIGGKVESARKSKTGGKGFFVAVFLRGFYVCFKLTLILESFNIKRLWPYTVFWSSVLWVAK